MRLTIGLMVVGCGGGDRPGTEGAGGGAAASACDLTNCGGCCDADGTCQSGLSSLACGNTGNRCVPCGSEMSCSGGMCAQTQTDGGGSDPNRRLRVFVSSATYTGKLATAGNATSGPAGGDNLCNLAAAAAGLGGQWVAWLSSSNADAIDRVTTDGAWYLVGTDTLAFRNKANLATKPAVAISVDENGDTVTGVREVWTGTGAGGRKSDHCVGWGSSDAYGTTGSASATDGWTDSGGSWCTNRQRLYCFEL